MTSQKKSSVQQLIKAIKIEHEYLANINLTMPKFRRKCALIKDLIHTQPVDINME